MSAFEDALETDWLGACRAATAELREVLAGHPSTRERAVETGDGRGGDRTLIIDDAAEEAVLRQMQELHRAGHRFSVVSEERGEVDFGGAGVRVIVDPIDGSLNAKRGMPGHAISIAVADGPTMGDVAFGYVYDFGTAEEWRACRGRGAFVDGRRLDPTLGERRAPDGRLEILAIEAADPRWVAASIEELRESCFRLRALGAIALSLCQVAAARADGMVTLRGCRAVDAAAAALIVREGGGLVSFPLCEAPLAAPLDLVPHSPVVAARSEDSLARLARIPTM